MSQWILNPFMQNSELFLFWCIYTVTVGKIDEHFCSVQLLSPTLCDPMNHSMSDSLWPHELQQPQASLSITNSWSPPKPMSIKSMMPSNHLILCHLLLFLPSIFLSLRVFSNESALHIRWPKYWSSSFSISPSSEYSGPISFRIHWFDILTVQGTLKSLLQDHNLKASVLQHSVRLWPSNKTLTT